MATILARITDGNKHILEVASDPSVAAGTVAPIGSIAMLSAGGVGTAWVKTGAANTAWSPISTSTLATAIRKPAQAAVTVALTDETIVLDTSGALGPFAVNLPASGAAGNGFLVRFANTGAGTTTYTLTPDATAPDTLDANVFATIGQGAQPVILQLLGTVWYLVGN